MKKFISEEREKGCQDKETAYKGRLFVHRIDGRIYSAQIEYKKGPEDIYVIYDEYQFRDEEIDRIKDRFPELIKILRLTLEKESPLHKLKTHIFWVLLFTGVSAANDLKELIKSIMGLL